MDALQLPPSSHTPLTVVTAIPEDKISESFIAVIYAYYDNVFGPVALQIFVNSREIKGHHEEYWSALATRWCRFMLSGESNSNDYGYSITSSLPRTLFSNYNLKRKYARIPDFALISTLICQQPELISAVLTIDRVNFHRNLDFLLPDILDYLDLHQDDNLQQERRRSAGRVEMLTECLKQSIQPQDHRAINWKVLEANFTWQFLTTILTAHLQSRYTLLLSDGNLSAFEELRILLHSFTGARHKILLESNRRQADDLCPPDACMITPFVVYRRFPADLVACRDANNLASSKWTEFNKRSVIIQRIVGTVSQIPWSLRAAYISSHVRPYLDRLSFILLRSLQPFLSSATTAITSFPLPTTCSSSSVTSPFTSPRSSPNFGPSASTGSSTTPTPFNHQTFASPSALKIPAAYHSPSQPVVAQRKTLFSTASPQDEDQQMNSPKFTQKLQSIFQNLLLPSAENYYDNPGSGDLVEPKLFSNNSSSQSANPRKPPPSSASSMSLAGRTDSLLHMNSNFLRRTLGASTVQSIVRFMNAFSMTSTTEDEDIFLDPDFALILGWTAARFRHTLYREILVLTLK